MDHKQQAFDAGFALGKAFHAGFQRGAAGLPETDARYDDNEDIPFLGEAVSTSALSSAIEDVWKAASGITIPRSDDDDDDQAEQSVDDLREFKARTGYTVKWADDSFRMSGPTGMMVIGQGPVEATIVEFIRSLRNTIQAGLDFDSIHAESMIINREFFCGHSRSIDRRLCILPRGHSASFHVYSRVES